MGYLSSEWRRFQRVIPAQGKPLAVVVEEPAAMRGAEVRDLSEGGLELRTPDADPAWLDLPVRLRLALPREAELQLRGRVRHVAADRLGVVFEALSADDLAVIRRYVDRAAGDTWWTRLVRMLQP